jgi:hypothetical protein
MSKFKYLLLCGYKGTGKDLFINELLFRNENWCIYSLENHQRNYEEIYKPRSKLGIFDSVRKDVSKQLGLPFSVTQLDQIKDNMIVAGKKLREYMNDIISKKCQEDKFFFENEALKNTIEEDDYITSDFRYNRTFDFFKNEKGGVLTARLFRSDIKVPDEKEKGEHILDNFVTDFLLVPKEDHEKHFNICRELLHQYKEYKLIYNPDLNS